MAVFQDQYAGAYDLIYQDKNYAEEVDAASGRALGNFPQAFSHVGLISIALTLEARREREAEQAPGAAAQ